MQQKTQRGFTLIEVIVAIAVVAILAGIGTVEAAGFNWGQAWLSLKLVGVLALVAYHGYLEICLTSFARGERIRTGRYYRFINEVPTLLLIWILIFVVVKPFA